MMLSTTLSTLLSVFVFVIFCSSMSRAIEDEEHDERTVAAVRMVHAYLASLKTFDHSQARNEVRQFLINASFEPKVVDEIISEAVDYMEEMEHFSPYADRFVRGMEEVINDPDCMEHEFDVADDDFEVEEALHVFMKCKLLVLRNLFDPDWLNDYRAVISDYHVGIHSGRHSADGFTTLGENTIIEERGPKRWEVILPRELLHRKVFANRVVMDILGDSHVLGDDLALHSFGTYVSEPGARAESWHDDEEYLFGDKSVEACGIAGHDLPSYAVGMSVPLLNDDPEFGPMEFCMGSSYLKGLPVFPSGKDALKIKDETLVDVGSLFDEFMSFIKDGACPPSMWRSPKLSFGDAIIFDYQLLRRGGANTGPALRCALELDYAHTYFKDSSYQSKKQPGPDFDIEGDPEDADDEFMFKLVQSARFAINDDPTPCEEDDCYKDEPKTMEEIQSPFLDYDENPEEVSEDALDFFVTNKDIGDGIRVYRRGAEVGTAGVRESLTVHADPGDLMEIKSSISGEIYKTWNVFKGQRQVVVMDPKTFYESE